MPRAFDGISAVSSYSSVGHRRMIYEYVELVLHIISYLGSIVSRRYENSPSELSGSRKMQRERNGIPHMSSLVASGELVPLILHS